MNYFRTDVRRFCSYSIIGLKQVRGRSRKIPDYALQLGKRSGQVWKAATGRIDWGRWDLLRNILRALFPQRAECASIESVRSGGGPVKRIGPILTLLAVAVFMAGMFAVDMTKAKRPVSPNAAAYPIAESGNPTPSTSASASASPKPTAVVSSTLPVASGFPPQVAFTGWTAEHEASIAIAVKANRAVAYLCDGAQVESWLRGKAERGALALEGKFGDSLTGRLSGRTVSGKVSLRGRLLAFSAVVTAPPGGLYTATVAAAQARVTWIVRADGGQTGLRTGGGQAGPAPLLDTTNLQATVDGATVRAVPVPGDSPPPG